VVLAAEATGQQAGPMKRQRGTARPRSRAQARAPFSESPGLQSGRWLPSPLCRRRRRAPEVARAAGSPARTAL